jgi:predicted nuclease with TOPRIM domain
MDSIAYTTLIKLLDEPMKALVVFGAVSSWFLIKKNSKLLDKTFEMFDSHARDMKEATKEINLTKGEMIATREKLVAEINLLRKQILETHAELKKLESSPKIAQIEKELQETFGRVINLDAKLDANEKHLTVTRRQLHDAIKVLAKHKEKLSKL